MDSRLSNLRTLLRDHSLDAILVSSLPNIVYLTNYAGFSTMDRDVFILVTDDNQYIFTHGIYKEDVKQKVTNFELIEITRENPIGVSIKNAVQKHSISKLGFEAFDLKVSEFDRLTKQVDKDVLQPSHLVNQLRIIKSSDEIDRIKQACTLGDKAFAYILKKVKLGVTESELAAEIEFFVKSHGAEMSFPTIVAFEENAAHPHHMPTNKQLKTKNFVLIDFGVLLHNYCSDMTRTISFGKATDEKKKIYQTVRKAQQNAIDLFSVKQSLKGSAPDRVSRDYIVSQGYQQMPHSLGHGIGLEVHESPRLTSVSEETLEEGMVFSIEPGIYLPGVAGVRIEDLFAIQNNTLVQLTNASRELIELEVI